MAEKLQTTPGRWDDDPDVQLMLRVREHDDPLAFEQLILRYSPRLLRILKNQIGNNGSAEDLVQEVFLRVYRARKTYKPTARFSTWLYHIANNVASNAVRDRNRRREYQLGAADPDASGVMAMEHIAIASTGSMPLRKLARNERAEMVRNAVEALPDRQRMALLLNKFEQLSYQEIAVIMNMNEKAVKSLLSRARVNVRICLEPYINDQPDARPPTTDPDPQA